MSLTEIIDVVDPHRIGFLSEFLQGKVNFELVRVGEEVV